MSTQRRVYWLGDGLDVHNVEDVVNSQGTVVCPKCKQSAFRTSGSELWQRGLFEDICWECVSCTSCEYRCIIRSVVHIGGVVNFESFIEELINTSHDSEKLP